MSGLRITAIRLLCPDPMATARFYQSAFGCTQDLRGSEGGVDEEGRLGRVSLRLGLQRLELGPASAPGERSAPSNSTAFQHCAIIVSDMQAAMARLAGVSGWSPISREGPELLPAASGGATAFKFRDPDGHPLEFLEFPSGAVPQPWGSMTGADNPCLGIDHTAITVADAQHAIAFYSALGFDVTERHVNRGPEQADMDGLNAAEVEVVTLMPQGGAPPHLELLCYRTPTVVSAPAVEGSPLATLLRLSIDAGDVRHLSDPDGHRVEVRPASTTA